MQSPYPYFGGKSRVAGLVWSAFGEVDNYVEPFYGSGAVHLAAPFIPQHETINDADGFVANFWRAVRAEPEAVAAIMNQPVIELDLEARHKWLVRMPEKAAFLDRMRDDPVYYDVQRAGWWCWGLCAWIGRGWCSGEWHGRGSEMNSGDGVNVRDESRGGKRPHLGNAGQGVHRQLPHLGDAGKGVHRQRPHLGDAGKGECARRLAVLVDWMQRLSDRLRNVRVCCGDWERVCGPTPTIKLGATGVFLDPPYSGEADRDNSLYRVEDLSVAHRVRDWCCEWGSHPDMRIALCGYEGEGHEELEAIGWRVVHWKAHGGMGVQGNADYQNKHRERIWFSPNCRVAAEQRDSMPGQLAMF